MRLLLAPRLALCAAAGQAEAEAEAVRWQTPLCLLQHAGVCQASPPAAVVLLSLRSLPSLRSPCHKDLPDQRGGLQPPEAHWAAEGVRLASQAPRELHRQQTTHPGQARRSRRSPYLQV